MVAELRNNATAIEIGKSWGKNQGWAATCECQPNRWGGKMIKPNFLEGQPIDAENDHLGHRQKVHRILVEVPQGYTGLLVTESCSFGSRKTERWYFGAVNGQIVCNDESIVEAKAELQKALAKQV